MPMSLTRMQWIQRHCGAANGASIVAYATLGLLPSSRVEYRYLLMCKAVWAIVGRLSLRSGRILLAIYRRPGICALTGVVFGLIIKMLRLFDFCFERSEFYHRRIALLLK